MNTALLPCTEVSTSENPEFAVIWLHGLGADGSDFVPVVPELGLGDALSIRFIFPDAPAIPVTCNGGYVMPAWYDIISLDATNRVIDEQGIWTARNSIRDLIAFENQRGIPCSNIVLAGFSQGGAVAYTTALTHPESLAGLIALSTYLPGEALIAREATEANQALNIFAGHGTDDEVVSMALGCRARDVVTQHGCQLEWHEYAIGHSVCIEEIRDIGRWLQRQLRVAS
jgi:phospholipase/carboxylesterase